MAQVVGSLTPSLAALAAQVDRAGTDNLAANVFAKIVSSALRGMPLLEGVPDGTINELAPLFKLELIGAKGHTLFSQARRGTATTATA